MPQKKKLTLLRQDVARLLDGKAMVGAWVGREKLSVDLCWRDDPPLERSEAAAAVELLPDLRPYFRGKRPRTGTRRLLLARETVRHLEAMRTTRRNDTSSNTRTMTGISPRGCGDGARAAGFEEIIARFEPIKTLWKR
jgi:hypothetical protein